MGSWHTLRMIWAEQLLWWAIKVAPRNGEDSYLLLTYVTNYMKESLRLSGYSKPFPKTNGSKKGDSNV